MPPPPQPQNYRVALIQLHPVPLSPAANFSTASTYIRNAASHGASLAILPEYHLTSWLPDHPDFLNTCASSWSVYLAKYCALASELKISIVPGTIVEVHKHISSSSSSSTTTSDDKEEDILLNIAYFISPTGSILHRYTKTNLWHVERPHLTPSPSSSLHTAFDTPTIGRVGLLICWDLAFPEAFRELIADGAKTIIAPTFWTLADCSEYGLRVNPRAEALFLENILTARAYENTCAVIMVNAGAKSKSTADGGLNMKGERQDKEKEPPYAGMSRVCLPFVGAMGDETKDTASEAMSIVDVNMEHVEEAEKNYKVREDMAREGWHYEYRHTKENGAKL